MKKNLIALTVGIVSLLSAHVFADEFADMYFTGTNPELTQQEKDAMAIAKRWQSGSAQNVKPVVGPDGSIRYLFGSQQTSVVCAVFQVCDIALQPGEEINGLHPGDSARWTFEPSVSGSGADQIQHIIVKPLDVGLETTLVVPTNRRVYHFRLRSHKSEFMPFISFSYPEIEQAKWQALRQKETQQRDEKTIPSTGEYLGDLNFDYKVSGKASWKPVRVYNDGVKTIIQMPKTVSQSEAPTLLVMRGNKDKDQVMVNYRVQGDRYIVDTIFDKAILIAGIGRQQDRITITRSK